MAVEARDALASKIMGKDIILKDLKTEKYGRLLCDIYLDDIHLNQWLIDERYALPYNGKKKTIPKSWIEYHETGILVT